MGFYLTTPEPAVLEPQSRKPENAYPRFAGVGSGMRFYKPGMGRFISRDPIGERGGVHLYVIALNRPTDLYDLLGKCSGCFTGDCELDALLGAELQALSDAIADAISDAATATTCFALTLADGTLVVIGAGVDGAQAIVDFIGILPPGTSWNFPPSYPITIPTPNGPVSIDIGALLTAIENFGPALTATLNGLESAVDAGRDAIAEKKEELCCDD